MANLVRDFGRLFVARRKVKLLGLILLIFPAFAEAWSETKYGPFVVEQAALWLPDYLSAEIQRSADPRKRRLLDSLKALATKFRRENFDSALSRSGRIQFREAGDAIFEIGDGNPPRMAVTGTAFDSDVIFNLGLIGDANAFSFSEALALWVHELGHKIESREFTREEIDAAAGLISRRYASQMKIYLVSGLKLLVLNPVPYALEGSTFAGPVRRNPSRFFATLGILRGKNFVDLSEEFNAELDRFTHPSSNKIEIKRVILQVLKLREENDLTELRLELRTSRLPKNLDHYVIDEIGPNYHKSARLKVSRDLTTVEVSHYVDEALPRPMIFDAEAELLDPVVSADRKQLSAFLKLHLNTDPHFHAASYPEARLTLHTLIDGDPTRLEARVHYRADNNHGMPAEVYKKPFVKTGTLTVDISKFENSEIEIIGIEDRFFTLGEGWSAPGEDQKRVRLRETFSIKLPNTCAGDLKSDG